MIFYNSQLRIKQLYIKWENIAKIDKNNYYININISLIF
jgi:hypothetical protein